MIHIRFIKKIVFFFSIVNKFQKRVGVKIENSFFRWYKSIRIQQIMILFIFLHQNRYEFIKIKVQINRFFSNILFIQNISEFVFNPSFTNPAILASTLLHLIILKTRKLLFIVIKVTYTIRFVILYEILLQIKIILFVQFLYFNIPWNCLPIFSLIFSFLIYKYIFLLFLILLVS